MQYRKAVMNQKDTCIQTDTGMYTMETTVRYSACGADRRTRLSDILDYLQDTCTFQAEELGVGLDFMQAHQTAWVLNSWQADVVRYPVFGETIRILTWPYDFHGFFGFRNFRIEDADGTGIVFANSVWVFMDLQKNRPGLSLRWRRLIRRCRGLTWSIWIAKYRTWKQICQKKKNLFRFRGTLSIRIVT